MGVGRGGYVDVELAAVDEPIHLGTDADDAMVFVRAMGIVEGLTNGLDEADTAIALDAVYRMLVAHQTADGVRLGSSAWLITARRP